MVKRLRIDCDKLAKIIEEAVKYRTPRKKYMSIEQREAYNKAIKKLNC